MVTKIFILFSPTLTIFRLFHLKSCFQLLLGHPKAIFPFLKDPTVSFDSKYIYLSLVDMEGNICNLPIHIISTNQYNAPHLI